MRIKVRVVVTTATRKIRFGNPPAAVRFHVFGMLPDRDRDVDIGAGPIPQTNSLVPRPFHDEPTPALGVETSTERVRALERRSTPLVGICRYIAVQGYRRTKERVSNNLKRTHEAVPALITCRWHSAIRARMQRGKILHIHIHSCTDTVTSRKV